MTIDLNPKFDFGKYFIYLCLILMGCLIMSLFKACGSNPEIPNNNILKESIKKDSIKEVIIKQDSVRIEYITKWRKLKADTIFMPCDTMLKKVITLCDTIIIKDSIQIASLKAEIVLSDTIIGKYKRVVKSDSIAICELRKDVKKERRKKNFFKVAGIIALGVAIVK